MSAARVSAVSALPVAGGLQFEEVVIAAAAGDKSRLTSRRPGFGALASRSRTGPRWVAGSGSGSCTALLFSNSRVSDSRARS
jgi:hypothetical protein